MIEFRCVLIFSLILSSTIVTGHSINRRDSQMNDEGDEDRMKMLKPVSDTIRMNVQKLKESLKMGFLFMKSRITHDEANSKSEQSSTGNNSTDDDTIIFNNEDEPDRTSALVTTIDESDATTVPTILNRSLLDTPIACGGGQQLGKDGKCRVVW